MYETRLILHHRHIRIFSETEPLEDHLGEHLWPYVQFVKSPDVDFTLHALAKSLSRQELEQLAEPNAEAGEINPIAVDPTTQGQTISWRSKNVAVLLNASPERLRQDMTRSLRQLLSYELQKDGLFLFNAAAVTLDDGALFIVGPPGAGKTTLAMAGVAQGAAYIANDVAVVAVREEGWWVQGYPDAISLVQPGKSTKRQIPLREYFEGRAERVSTQPVPIRDVVVPQAVSEPGVLCCHEISPEEGAARMLDRLHRDRRLPPHAWPGGDGGCRFHSLRFSYGAADMAFHHLQDCKQAK